MKTLVEDLTICEEWDLSVDLKMSNQSTTEWKKVFSLQPVNRTTNLTAGSSIVAVWVWPNKLDLKLLITFDIDSKEIFTYNFTNAVNAGNWINLQISQVNEKLEIKVDYRLVHSRTNSLSKKWTNVKLITENLYATENVSTIVQYRKLEIGTCKPKGMKRALPENP